MKAHIKFFTLCLLLIAPTLAADNSIEARLWASVENTRLVLESDHRLKYSVSDIDAPPRLFIDITHPDGAARLNTTLQMPAQPYISGVRSAPHNASTTRIVFDLAAGVHYRVHRIKPIDRYRHRLVIDIAPQTPPADPLLSLLQQLDKEKQSSAAPPFLVVVDPGHGGEDPGAVSPNNRYEKTIVLQISQKLAKAINTRPGMKALLTRSTDRFIPLLERVKIAHRLDADVFVSVHADSVRSRKPRGSSVFVLSKKGASTAFARRLAKQENLSDMIGGQPPTNDPFLDSALRQFSQDGKERASRELGLMMLNNMGRINKLRSKNVESAGFAVLKSPSIPSVLVETAFISNAIEEKKLIDPKFQQQLADALANALHTYYNRHHITE